MHYIYVIIIGFVAGLIAKFIMPGPNEPSGFILTTVLGVVGSFIASFIAQKMGWAHGGEGVTLISGVVGAVILLFIYNLIVQNTGARI